MSAFERNGLDAPRSKRIEAEPQRGASGRRTDLAAQHLVRTRRLVRAIIRVRRGKLSFRSDGMWPWSPCARSTWKSSVGDSTASGRRV